jgi:hypothetical protein
VNRKPTFHETYQKRPVIKRRKTNSHEPYIPMTERRKIGLEAVSHNVHPNDLRTGLTILYDIEHLHGPKP